MIPPFQIRSGNLRFVHTTEIEIELEALEPDVYRVVAVQNFWIEDHDADLERCMAGIFLARRRHDGSWEEPETWPIECRTLKVLGTIDTGGALWIPATDE